MDLSFQYEVNARLSSKPHLYPLFSDLYDICSRIREIDDTLFVVYNRRLKRYEVHSTEHRPDTFAWAVPYPDLDERTLRLARRNNLLVRGRRIFREIDEHNERLEESNRRRFLNEMRAAALESRSLFAKMRWEI